LMLLTEPVGDVVAVYISSPHSIRLPDWRRSLADRD
jgi:hypothetical protein